MITFNGIALEQVAPVKVVDIRVAPIQMSATARQRPITWGADFVRLRGGSRTASIDFALLTDNIDERQRQLAAITRWARSDEPKRLELPNRRGAYLEAICTALPEPSLRQWWESKLRIVFTTYDNPYWTSIAEKSAACYTDFFVLGDAPPLMRIERTLAAAASNQYYSSDDEIMRFTEIPEGDLVIDLNRQTAAIDDVSIMDQFEFGSKFIIPRTGLQSISGQGTIHWRERWS